MQGNFAEIDLTTVRMQSHFDVKYLTKILTKVWFLYIKEQKICFKKKDFWPQYSWDVHHEVAVAWVGVHQVHQPINDIVGEKPVPTWAGVSQISQGSCQLTGETKSHFSAITWNIQQSNFSQSVRLKTGNFKKLLARYFMMKAKLKTSSQW